jgi:hypothetical protein
MRFVSRELQDLPLSPYCLEYPGDAPADGTDTTPLASVVRS